jgi:dihydrofolate reductase
MSTNPRYHGYIAMSLDGFIADSTGSIEWLDPFNAALGADGGDGGYQDFIAPIDALILGRSTYDQVMGWGWPYDARPGYMLTRNATFSGDHIAAAGSIETLRNAINAAGHEHIWVMGGGKTQRAALDAGLFHSLKLFVMPTILGAGLPCFAPGRQHNLTLTGSAQLPGGILQIDYHIKD